MLQHACLKAGVGVIGCAVHIDATVEHTLWLVLLLG